MSNNKDKMQAVDKPGNVNSKASSLQNLINLTKDNGILEIDGGEYLEIITITKPITLKGKSLVSIIENSNVLSIQSKNVVLENIYIECNDRSEVCLNINEESNPKFINVFVRGKVIGALENGDLWGLPESALELIIKPKVASYNLIRISSPINAKVFLQSDVMSIDKSAIEKGINEIQNKVKEIESNSYVFGELVFENEIGLKRKISLHGNTFQNISYMPETMTILWDCENIIRKVTSMERPLNENTNKRPLKEDLSHIVTRMPEESKQILGKGKDFSPETNDIFYYGVILWIIPFLVPFSFYALYFWDKNDIRVEWLVPFIIPLAFIGTFILNFIQVNKYGPILIVKRSKSVLGKLFALFIVTPFVILVYTLLGFIIHKNLIKGFFEN